MPSEAATLRPAVLPCRIACCDVGEQSRPGFRVGDRGGVAESPDVVLAAHAQVVVDHDATVLVDRQPGLRALGCGTTPAVQTTVRVPTVSPVEIRAEGRRLLEGRPEADVDPPPAQQLAQGIVRQAGLDLGQDPVHRLHQDPAHSPQAFPWIGLDRLGGEVLQLRQRLEACAAAPTNTNVSSSWHGSRVMLVSATSMPDRMVQPDGVGEALEPDRMVGQPEDRQHP